MSRGAGARRFFEAIKLNRVEEVAEMVREDPFIVHEYD